MGSWSLLNDEFHYLVLANFAEASVHHYVLSKLLLVKTNISHLSGQNGLRV